MSLKQRLQALSHQLRRDAHLLWIATKDPRTPLLAKLVTGLVATYVLSPIDLIPDFVPLFGLLDELIVVPVGLMFALWLIPPPLMDEFREQADAAAERPVSRLGAVLVILLWVLIGSFIALQLWALRFW